jgi:hypothetical protein
LYLTESVTFVGNSGESEIVLGANLSDALSIKDNVNDIVVIDTTVGSLNVSINPPTVLGTSLQIGTSVVVNDILDEDNMVSNSNSALATQQSIKAYVDSQIPGGDINFTTDAGSGAVNLATETLTVNGSPNEIVTTGSGQTLTIGLPNDVTITNDLNVGGNLEITGDLTVNGTTTTINTQTLEVGDNKIVLNSDETLAPTQDAGIEIERGTSTNVLLQWNETSDQWELTTDGVAYGRILTTIDEGSGNNLDADTVDGQHYEDIVAEATALAIALG